MKTELSIREIGRSIHFVRGHRVMLDQDLATLYGVPTSRLNEQVKRNKSRFPEDFCFRLTATEWESVQSQRSGSGHGRHGGRRKLPNAFTQEGVAMLSSVLSSERAVQVNIAIMRTFVKIREMLDTHRDLAQKIERLERKYQGHDEQFKIVFATIREIISPVGGKRHYLSLKLRKNVRRPGPGMR